MNETAAKFLADVRHVRWFANLGAPETDAQQSLGSWADWQGPQNPDTERIHLEQQALYDELTSNEADARLVELFNAVRDEVIAVARTSVPYDDEGDAWHGPTLAVWHAAWTAALIVLCYETGHYVPSSLAEQWRWFAHGHWPAAYASGDETTTRFVLL